MLIESNNTTLVIDAGPDFRQQMLRENVRHLDAIVLTHEHKDHISGMDDVRAFNYKSQDAIDIYAEERVQAAVRKDYSYVFAEYQYPGIPRMRLNNIPDYGFTVNKLTLVPLRIFHYRLPILGFRLGNFAYITDAKGEIVRSEVFCYQCLKERKTHFSLQSQGGNRPYKGNIPPKGLYNPYRTSDGPS